MGLKVLQVASSCSVVLAETNRYSQVHKSDRNGELLLVDSNMTTCCAKIDNAVNRLTHTQNHGIVAKNRLRWTVVRR